jgi:OOP family OmpA-OmpF porin
MKKTLLSLAAGLALLASPAAFAQGYAGFGIGQSNIDIDCTGATSCDKSSTGYKLYGGFKFPNNLAAELVYFDWGKAKGSGSLLIDTGEGTVEVPGTGEVKATGWGIGVAYFMPFNPAWNGALRLGIAQNKAKTTLTATTGDSMSESYTVTEPYYGFGIGWMAAPNLTVTGEIDFSRIKYLETEKAGVRLISVGVRWMF